MAVLLTVSARGLAADRPDMSGHDGGPMYYSTDTKVAEHWDGSSWVVVATDLIIGSGSDEAAAGDHVHAAGQVTVTPVDDVVSTDVQAALEYATSVAVGTNTDLVNHLIDASGAHAASAVSFNPSGTPSSEVTVQLALAEALNADGGFTNPMTTQDDIIVAGSAGAAARLAKGTDGQVLTVDPTTHHLIWATPSSGFANPMNTAGDIILGGSSGTPGRLAKGSDSQVLTVDPTTHLPLWATPSGGGGGGAADVILDYTEATDLFTNAAVTIDTWTQLVANKTFTIAASGRIQVNILGTFQVTTTGGSTTIAGARAIIDSGGTPITRHLNSMQGNSGGVFLGFAGSFALEGLATGAHTIKIEFRATGAGTKNLYLRASTDQYEHFHVDVVELP